MRVCVCAHVYFFWSFYLSGFFFILHNLKKKQPVGAIIGFLLILRPTNIHEVNIYTEDKKAKTKNDVNLVARDTFTIAQSRDVLI